MCTPMKGQAHAHQAAGIQHRTHQQHTEGTEAVGQQSRQRPGQAPGQVLHRQRKGEGFARPAAVHGDGLQPQAEAVADAHAQRDDGGAADQHLRHRQPLRHGSCIHSAIVEENAASCRQAPGYSGAHLKGISA